MWAALLLWCPSAAVCIGVVCPRRCCGWRVLLFCPSTAALKVVLAVAPRWCPCLCALGRLVRRSSAFCLAGIDRPLLQLVCASRRVAGVAAPPW